MSDSSSDDSRLSWGWQESSTVVREDVPSKGRSKAYIKSQESEVSVMRLKIQEQSVPNGGAEASIPRPRQFTFRKDSRLFLGRSPSCTSNRTRQLVAGHEDAVASNGLDDGFFSNQVISKVHGAIYERDGELVLVDQDSTHGTFVNGEKVETARILQDSDRVRLGRNVTRKGVQYKALEFVVGIEYGICSDVREGATTLTTSHDEAEHTVEHDSPPLSSIMAPREQESEPIDPLTMTGCKRKRVGTESPDPAMQPPESKRTAFVIAALAGVIVGSVGTIVTLASM
ncbi:hypothetical protein BG011_002041 [Mortierella polycephala]|uniref:FHA domain-containing protein n=1 Tax=Mortierella polycephala TaxID=41804 RepID=A0A9P6U5P0_9FUNG|nr:hypothetical protein BG011_002041 [Mortierella polycephala]